MKLLLVKSLVLLLLWRVSEDPLPGDPSVDHQLPSLMNKEALNFFRRDDGAPTLGLQVDHHESNGNLAPPPGTVPDDDLAKLTGLNATEGPGNAPELETQEPDGQTSIDATDEVGKQSDEEYPAHPDTERSDGQTGEQGAHDELDKLADPKIPKALKMSPMPQNRSLTNPADRSLMIPLMMIPTREPTPKH